MQSIVSGMIGCLENALWLAEEECWPKHEKKKLQLYMAVKNVQARILLRKAVTFKNAQVFEFIHNVQTLSDITTIS